MQSFPEYRITTIKELIDAATPENIDNLLTDLKHHILLSYNGTLIDPHIFKWVDDGQTDVHIKMKTWTPLEKEHFFSKPSEENLYSVYSPHTNEVLLSPIDGIKGNIWMTLPDDMYQPNKECDDPL